jgi:CO/xanthine dehydrogenase Mo-binding subunit
MIYYARGLLAIELSNCRIVEADDAAGAMRLLGPISTFVMERLIDMAARRPAIDPAELRLRNLIRPEEFPYKVASAS